MERSGSAYPDRVDILLWLVPPAAVTLGAMVWVSWVAREGRGEIDRDVAVQRLAAAMAKDHRSALSARPERRPDRSTGIAVRPTRAGPARGRTSGDGSGPETRRVS